jgi:hypothetical protein
MRPVTGTLPERVLRPVLRHVQRRRLYERDGWCVSSRGGYRRVGFGQHALLKPWRPNVGMARFTESTEN